MNYYLQLRGRAYGPFTADKVRVMCQNGSVNAESLISTDKRNWREAGSFPEFFDAPQSAVNTVPQQTSPAVPPAPAFSSKPCWFVSYDGKEGFGPYSAQAISDAVASGNVNAETLVWRQGETARPMSDEPEFSSLFAKPASTSTNNAASNPNLTSNLAEQLHRRYLGYWISWALFFIVPTFGWALAELTPALFEESLSVQNFLMKYVVTPCRYGAPLVCYVVQKIFLLMFVYSFWRSLPAANAPTTPGPACGLLLVPFFYWYWNFVVFYQGTIYANASLKKLAPEVASRTQVSETLALLYAILELICMPISLCLSFPLLAQMRNVGAALAKAEAQDSDDAFNVA